MNILESDRDVGIGCSAFASNIADPDLLTPEEPKCVLAVGAQVIVIQV